MSEFPKMLFRSGGDGENHKIGDVPLKIMNRFECETLIVDDAQAEADALAEGWSVSPDPEVMSAAQIQAATLSEKDAKIELLRAELAEAQRRRGGRPRKEEGVGEASEEVTDGDAA